LLLHKVKRALILNAPKGYLAFLGELPGEVEIATEPEGEFDFVHLFIKDSAELEAYFDHARQVSQYDGVFWISYPKGSSGVKTDLNRDKLWAVLLEKGIRPVTQVSIDEVWSAIRFRPKEAVGK
jgi:hypothetical protein